METLYAQMQAAERNWQQKTLAPIEEAVATLDKLEVAERAYYTALKIAREDWEALPASERKDSAEQNAHDSQAEGCFPAGDELSWLEFAIRTYQLIGE